MLIERGRFAHKAVFAAPLLCLLFGLGLLIFVVGPGDGTWVLYGREMRSGLRIYSDLNLNQQPMFPLISFISLIILPDGILAQKIAFALLILVHVGLLFKISCRVASGLIERTILTLSAYFVSIHFEAFRYEDYHALAQCLVLASFNLSLRHLDENIGPYRYATAQGVLFGLTFLTRVNEGIAIAGAVSIVALAKTGWSRKLIQMCGSAALSATIVFVAILTAVGESPATWFQQTLAEAASAKGGASLWTYPALALWNACRYLAGAQIQGHHVPLLLFCIATHLVVFLRRNLPRALQWAVVVAAGVSLFQLITSLYRDPAIPLTASALLWCTVYFVTSFIRARLWPAVVEGTKLEGSHVLTAYPLLLFAMGSLSTGGYIYGLYFALTLTIYVVALFFREAPSSNTRQRLRVLFYIVMLLTALNAFEYRRRNSFSWLDYRSGPLFQNYVFVEGSGRGPHMLPKEVDGLIRPICKHVGDGKTLLSLPYSFPNYYCKLPLWHGVVQTFFDTSTRSQIDRIKDGLLQDPPDFILYQRQLAVMQMHERIYNHGRPLPHRKLDQLIMEKVRSGEWKIIQVSTAFSPSQWFLIKTK
ncbi:MAG: hypothetical protein ABIO43_03575 [Sphingomicrobium sp.]